MYGRKKKPVYNAKIRLKKGDTVYIKSGDYKNKGHIGKVLGILPKKGQIIVEGSKMMKRHQRPTQKFQAGGIIEKERPIHISNVMLYCVKCSKPTRIKIGEVAGKKVRICKKCGEIIDKV